MDANDATFQKEVIESSNEKPVLVDFWAAWCGPCQILKPVLERIAEDYKDKMKLVKVNVEEAQQSAQQYGIMSIPSVKLFKNGQVIDQFMGSQPEPKIREWLDKVL